MIYSIITIIDYHQIEFPLIDQIWYIKLSDYMELSDYIQLSDYIKLLNFIGLYQSMEFYRINRFSPHIFLHNWYYQMTKKNWLRALDCKQAKKKLKQVFDSEKACLCAANRTWHSTRFSPHDQVCLIDMLIKMKWCKTIYLQEQCTTSKHFKPCSNCWQVSHCRTLAVF